MKNVALTKKIHMTYLPAIFMILAVGMWGGFYHFTTALWGGIFSALLLLLYYRNGFLQIFDKKDKVGIVVLLILFCSFISIVFAVDRGMAVIGLIRIFTLFLFWLVWKNITQNAREKVFEAIPMAGVVWTLVSWIFYFFSFGKKYFYQANRLGGPFQYANAYAIFLLIGLILLLYEEEIPSKKLPQIFVLFAGIFFTGSRSVFVLTLILALMYLFRKHIDRKKKLFLVGGTVGMTLLLQLFFRLDLGRLVKLTLDSSTLNGRFLYWVDAVHVLFQHPFGMGYMGYFYLQPQFQTGNYVTRFVHNDVLQAGLDYGILAMAACIYLAGYGLRKQKGKERLVLIVLILHCLFDFDLQFSLLACIGLMCVKCESEKKSTDHNCSKRRETLILRKKDKKERVFFSLVCIFLSILYLYFSVAFWLEYAGQYQTALSFYPWNTEAAVSLLKKGKSNQAQVLAKRNGLLPDVWEILLSKAVSEQASLSNILDYERQMLACAGYDGYYYNQAVYYLSFILAEAIRTEDEQGQQKIIKEIISVSEQISRKENEASFFARRIQDKPEIKLEPEIKEYIEEVDQYRKNTFDYK